MALHSDLTPKQQADLDLLEKLVVVLRDYLMDKEEVNHLVESEEYEDTQLHMYIMMALDCYNTSVTPISIRSSLSEFPSLTLLLEGAAIYALKSSIFKYIRNSFQYNDAGVQASVEEKAGEYERTVQRMLAEFTQKAQAIKEHINLEGCYGGFNSEYLNLYIVGRRTRKV